MFRWLRQKTAPLSGAPAVRRIKTYSAQSGYVYQYFYQGHRLMPSGRGTEYVFSASLDRKALSPVAVRLSDEAIESWQEQSGRMLSGTERYAIAKLALFKAFDERETPDAMRDPVEVTPDDVRSLLATLNID